MKPRPAFLVVAVLSLFCVGSWPAGAWAQSETCTGDCDSDGSVTVDEVIMGVNIALGSLPLDECPEFDLGSNGEVNIDDLIAGVNNGLAGCGSQANRAPHASDVSLSAESATPYVEKQLIGSDPDNDSIVYELIANDTSTGYSFAYVNPESGVLYLTLADDFQGTIVLPYHVTDGKLFSNTANVTIELGASMPSGYGGAKNIDPREYASYPRGFYYGDLLGAPGENPTLPSSVDLSRDFPLPGNQGRQSSCVAWALGYGIKTYHERLELGWSLEAPEHQFSPAYIYNQLNHGRDDALIYLDALNFVVNEGVATLARMPYNDLDYLTQPSAAARQEASRFKAKTWNTANGILDAKAALANRLPVFMVIQLMTDIHALRGPDSVYNTFGGTWEIGHGVAAVGYDDNRYGGAFRIMNSWGRDWGDGGYFWMPYWTTTHTVETPDGPTPVLTGAVVVEDAPDPGTPDPDPVDPPLPTELPDLQVTDWKANFDDRPGGAGSLQYVVTNTGITTAPAGAYVALLVSSDPTFATSNTLVVYEQIPFDMAPGSTAYRDQDNAIAFNFPYDLEPGQYYMAVSADAWHDVVESNEHNNISPAGAQINIVNTSPDMQVVTWYANWDELGQGSLTYEVVNGGASVASAGWLVTLALSPNDTFGDGDEIFLFSEPANFDLGPGGTLYRHDSMAASFSLYFDYFGNRVPEGDYHIALWLDPNGYLTESNEINNASLSWATIGIGTGAGLGAGASTLSSASTRTGALVPREAYNGKTLPAPQTSARTVRIGTTPHGSRQRQSHGEGAVADSGPGMKAAEPHPGSKIARALQQVIFPSNERKAMPKAD